MRSALRLALMVSLFAVPAAADEPAADAPPTAREARRLLRLPRGSISLSLTNGGSLRKGVELPLKGRGYAFFSMIQERKTHFATAELAGLIRRVGKQMAKQFPGSVVGIGNIGFEEGGEIPWSVSHQSGRDVDLAMFALDRRGRRTNLRAFIPFFQDGRDRHARYTFDDERNLALVMALMTDDEVQVQWIFVAAWLKARLMRRAEGEGVDAELLRRMDTVLKQPGDSNPHHHHFHVRLYCSVQDRLHGCLERGPIWDWVDLGDDAWRARIQQLERLLRMSSPRWRRRAVQALEDIRAQPAIPTLAAALHDRDRRVRQAALSAIRAIRDPETAGLLVAEVEQAENPEWRASIFAALLKLEAPESLEQAHRMVRAPDELAPDVPASIRAQMQRAALRLLGVRARAEVVPAVARLLAAGDMGLRAGANLALQRLTNQRIATGRRAARDATALVAAWAPFIAQAPHTTWLDWMRAGFEARGYDLPEGVLDWPAVDVLIEALRDDDEVAAHNACKVLVHITGYDIDPRHRSRRNTQRVWRRWRARYLTYTGAHLAERRTRRSPELHGAASGPPASRQGVASPR